MKDFSKKIIYINVVILFIIFSVSEILSYSTYCLKYKDLIEKQNKNNSDGSLIHIRYTFPKFVSANIDMKDKVFKGNSKKRPIVTIGCSYTYGILLKPQQTFAAKLNKYTHRTTYNRGICGTGPQMVYKQINSKILKKDIDDAEYIIYTYIHGHLYRTCQHLLCYYLTDINPIYKYDGLHFYEQKQPFWFTYSFFTVKNILFYIDKINQQKEFLNNYRLFVKIMEETSKSIKKIYPNTKFVILDIPDAELCEKEKENIAGMPPEIRKEIENMGIIYIDSEELIGHKLRDTKKYRMPDGDHPNEKLWDEITPALVKKLNL